MDEYDRYKSLHPIKDAFRKPVKWWRDHLDEYPTLSRMALDFFSVPAMSSECERVFSLAKLILTTQRRDDAGGNIMLKTVVERQRIELAPAPCKESSKPASEVSLEWI